MTHPLHEVLEALESGHDFAEDVHDGEWFGPSNRRDKVSSQLLAAISKVRLLMEEKNQPLSVDPAVNDRTLPAAPQLDTPCAIEAERAPVELSGTRLYRAAFALVERNQRDSLAHGMLANDVYPMLEELEAAVFDAYHGQGARP